MRTTYDLLRDQPFLAALTDWQLERLARRGARSVLPKGTMIFRDGESADRLWLVVSGEIAVQDASGATVDRLGPGAVLGWSSLVPPYRRRFRALALTTTVAIWFDGPAVRELTEADPVLGFHLQRAVAGVVARRLDAARRQVSD